MVGFINNRRGIALILTILIVGLIVSLTLHFNTSMRSNLYAAANLSDGIKLGCIARSGFDGARAVLHEDRFSGNVDTLRELWAQSAALSESAAILFDEGKVFVEIRDLSGGIQINQLVDDKGKYNEVQKGLLLRFLNSSEFGLEPDEAENIVDALKDWIDSDNEVTRFGAEDSYYQGLEKPYRCKNAPLEFLEELGLVRGITQELLYGSAEKPAILPYLSPYGAGRININTADPVVLRALSDRIDEDLVEAMVAYRDDEDNDLSDAAWYKKVPGMSDVNIPDSLLTTSSTHFEIVSEGRKEPMRKRITGAVERNEKTVKILSFRVE